MKSRPPALTPALDETLDPFFDGTLQILQKKAGYRFSIDAVLLSRFAKVRRNEKVIDLGTGCGILPLLLSRTTEASLFVGVEIQGGLAECARKNVDLNLLADRISIVHQDMRELHKTFPAGSFHVVVSNPPYRKERSGRVNPTTEKAIARHEIRGTLSELAAVASHLLRPGGRCYLTFPASRAVDLLTTLRSRGLEPKTLQIVFPRLQEGGKLLLVEAIKSSGIELKIMKPLILHEG